MIIYVKQNVMNLVKLVLLMLSAFLVKMGFLLIMGSVVLVTTQNALLAKISLITV